MIEKSTVIARDTTTISRVTNKDSTSKTAKIDSIIIEEYAADDRSEHTTESNNNPRHKVSSYRNGNDTSQSKPGSMKKKTKIYGVNLSDTWLSINDSLNKKMTHEATTKSEIKQITPTAVNAGGKNIYALIAFAIALFVGYCFWKNAVQ